MTRSPLAAGCVLVVLSLAACAQPRESEPGAAAEGAAPGRVLRVCADPNNLPFSNEAGEGFENRIADVVADALDAKVEYTWWAQRRGFLRNTLNAGTCDVVMGLPSSVEMALATRPYYRSTYVFVTRRDRQLDVTSFDDPRLRQLRVGVQIVGDDYANAPPAHALSRRGAIRNVVGYSVYGDYRQPHPVSAIVDAVDRGDVDVSVAWGPVAGYFAQHAAHLLDLTPVSPQIDLPFLPFVFDIAMAVRRGDNGLKEELERVLEERRDEIDRILAEYGVPRLDRAAPEAAS